jgi:hypothetical protein
MTLFLVGLAVSIPAAIIANILTPWTKNKWGQRSSKRKVKRARQIIRMLQKVDRYRAALNELIAYVAIRIIAIIVVLAYAVLFTVLVTTGLGYSYYGRNIAWDVIVTAIGLLAIVMLFLAVFTATSTRRLLRNIVNYETYRKHAELELEALDTSISQAITAFGGRNSAMTDGVSASGTEQTSDPHSSPSS